MLSYFNLFSPKTIDIVTQVTVKRNEKQFIELPENVMCNVYIKSINNKGGKMYFTYNGNSSLTFLGKNEDNIVPVIIHESNGFYVSFKKELEQQSINPCFINNENICKNPVVISNVIVNNIILTDKRPKEVTYIIRIIGI